MARSAYIYAVLTPDPKRLGWNLVAAFTVRHELVEWWRRNGSKTYVVFRTRDGGPSHTRPTTDITEEMP